MLSHQRGKSVSQAIDNHQTHKAVLQQQFPARPAARTRLLTWTSGSMEYAYDLFRRVQYFYTEMNSATLTGAIDVVVRFLGEF